MVARLVYRFTDDIDDRSALGNKGANLVKMVRLGMPVPLGFTISIEASREFERNRRLPVREIGESIAWLEMESGSKLGDGLQVSVRSSGPVSMPGMMDTLLNVSSEKQLLTATKEVFARADSRPLRVILSLGASPRPPRGGGCRS